MKLLCIFRTADGDTFVSATRGPNIARQELASLINQEVFLADCRLAPSGVSAQNIVKRLATAFPSTASPVGFRLDAEIAKLSWELTKICVFEPKLKRIGVTLRRTARQILRKLTT